jgi:hypothetical protein
MIRPLDFVVLQAAAPPAATAAYAQDAGGQVVRFGADGAAQPATANGPAGTATVERFGLVVRYLAGMTELVVTGAELRVSGRRVDQPPAGTAHGTAADSVTLTGPGGTLRRIEISGLAAVPPGGNDTIGLAATRGGTAGWRWRRDEDGVHLERATGGDRLRLLVRAQAASGAFGPPQVAVPPYAMPGNQAGMYGPVLAGGTLALDEPATGSARLDLDPPVAAGTVRLMLGLNEGDPADDLPHQVKPVPWTATDVRGTWSAAPTGVRLTATAAPAPGAILLAEFRGELADGVDVDVAPAARSLLAAAYPAAGGGDLRLEIAATSTTPGELVASGLRVDAYYRYDAVAAGPREVALLGAPMTVELPLPAGPAPGSLTLTVDGTFGAGVLLTASDRDRPAPRDGVRLAGPVQACRRLAVGVPERGRPLIRVGLFGRAAPSAAQPATELLFTLHADAGGRVGPPLGPPVSLRVGADRGAWYRTDLPAPVDAGRVEAVWVAVQATAGVFWWYAADPAGTPTDTRLSTDAGATWADTDRQVLTQVHYASERAEPSPLRLLAPAGLVAADLLDLPAARSRIETTAAAAVRRAPRDAGEPAGLTGLPARTREAASAAFRLEGIRPLAGPALARLAGATALPLTFGCDRDVTVRVEAAELTYDPWGDR